MAEWNLQGFRSGRMTFPVPKGGTKEAWILALLVERKSEPAKNRASQLIKMLHQSALVSQMELPDGQLSTLSIDVLTPSGAYFMFAGLAACAFTFIGRYVPETRGKSLEEIERTLTERFSAGPGVPREVAIVDSLEMAPSSSGQAKAEVV